MKRRDHAVKLLVEGRDDKFALIGLLKAALEAQQLDWDREPWCPYIDDLEGVEKVLEALPVAIKSSRVLGVVVDADEDRDARWRALRDRLRLAGVALPDTTPAGGHVGPGLLPGSRLGVWVMPDNRLPGVLEDFVGALVPAGDARWTYAQQAVEQAVGLAPPIERNLAWRSKAVLHTWLAWQVEPGQPLGQAITARVLSRREEPVARDFVAWFDRLYRPENTAPVAQEQV